MPSSSPTGASLGGGAHGSSIRSSNPTPLFRTLFTAALLVKAVTRYPAAVELALLGTQISPSLFQGLKFSFKVRDKAAII